MGNIGTGLGNLVKGGAHMLTHPEEMVTGAISSLPPVQLANDLSDAYKHIKGEPNAGDELRAHPAENLRICRGRSAPLFSGGWTRSIAQQGAGCRNA